MKDMKIKIAHASDVIIEALGEKTIRAMAEFRPKTYNSILKENSEISEGEVVDILEHVFGDTSSVKSVVFGNDLCRYLDIDQISGLRKVISSLGKKRDIRIETISTLRDLSAYYCVLAMRFNQGMFRGKTALRCLMASVTIYDILHRLCPYVFDDVEFESTNKARIICPDQFIYPVSEIVG